MTDIHIYAPLTAEELNAYMKRNMARIADEERSRLGDLAEGMTQAQLVRSYLNRLSRPNS